MLANNTPKKPDVFQQKADNTWWCVWSGYSIGPFESEELAVAKFEEIKAKYDCATGSCDE